MKVESLYLAGPMSWLPQFNIPEFERWAAELRDRGFVVVSPAEEDDPDVRIAALASRTGDPADLPTVGTGGDPLDTALANVRAIARCDGVALLDGWERSLGTRHEVETAHRWTKPVAPVWLWAGQ